ncbi:hypothetical protein MHYP_G00050480 [Metynnis hypsauchen]
MIPCWLPELLLLQCWFLMQLLCRLPILQNQCPSATVAVSPQSLPFVPFALVTVIFLHIIVDVVYHTKRNKEHVRGQYCTADGDGVAMGFFCWTYKQCYYHSCEAY